MEELFNSLISLIKSYNPDEVEIVTRAYEFAKECHKNQLRKSGEPYIIHPLEVTIILANMRADRDTLCAGLLHDVIEDCNVTKEQIAELFNPKIAELVDGVTNLTKADFQNKQERSYGNKRKIILGIVKDARIVIIKLADRLHNMKTLQYQNTSKQHEKSEETLQFYAPLARYIGAEKIRRKLEDLSFQYLDPAAFNDTKAKMTNYINRKSIYIKQMLKSVAEILDANDVPALIKHRIKNIYSVYRKLEAGEFLDDIHDLIAIKVLTDEIKNCYYSLGLVHSLYLPYNSTFKDYICDPKPNMYSSLHTSVIGLDDTITQIQIRTKKMERINMHGLTAYWSLFEGEAGDKMQEVLRDKYKYDQSVKRLNDLFTDSKYFVTNFSKNVIGEGISVYDYDGYLSNLPEGSTVIDFAYNFGADYARKMVGAFVNGRAVDVDTVLHNGDRVHVLVSEEKLGPSPTWLTDATLIETQKAIRKSLEGK